MINRLSVEEVESGQLWRVKWHSYVPSIVLVAAMVVAWLASRQSGSMASWGISAAALADGEYENILLHMFAHGGLLHLLLNSLALLEIGGLVVARLGGFPQGWLRALIAFLLSGLSSMIFFLSFHPFGHVPMVGASGAVYGLMGLLLGMRLIEEVELSQAFRLPGALLRFAKNNLFFIALLLISGLLAGLSARVAWEAHAGGFMFGLCIGPWVLPPLPPDRDRGLAPH
jgi:membrane associated rhomboid family serine protease